MPESLDLGLFDRPPPKPKHWLTEPVTEIIMGRYHQTPRHLQVEIGPSEIGEDCARKLAYKIMREPVTNSGSDPLPSIVGTAAHTWMEGALQLHNERIGRTRYIMEAELTIVPGMIGHCDCLDCDTWTVLDWKFPGTTQMKKYRADGPSHQYRAQAHLYGMGWIKKGAPIREVAIVFLPRGGFLKDMYIWSEPYDQSIADRALERYYNITELAVTMDVEHQPENYARFPIVNGHNCTYCDWFNPAAKDARSCKGWLIKNA